MDQTTLKLSVEAAVLPKDVATQTADAGTVPEIVNDFFKLLVKSVAGHQKRTADGQRCAALNALARGSAELAEKGKFKSWT